MSEKTKSLLDLKLLNQVYEDENNLLRQKLQENNSLIESLKKAEEYKIKKADEEIASKKEVFENECQVKLAEIDKIKRNMEKKEKSIDAKEKDLVDIEAQVKEFNNDRDHFKKEKEEFEKIKQDALMKKEKCEILIRQYGEMIKELSA